MFRQVLGGQAFAARSAAGAERRRARQREDPRPPAPSGSRRVGLTGSPSKPFLSPPPGRGASGELVA
jgi:hypothetical protein